jgi:hypothetical protein
MLLEAGSISPRSAYPLSGGEPGAPDDRLQRRDQLIAEIQIDGGFYNGLTITHRQRRALASALTLPARAPTWKTSCLPRSSEI